MDDQSKINQAKEAYYESLIKQALEELVEKEAQALLPNDKYDIIPSDQHIKRVNALFRHEKRKKAAHQAALYFRKTAAVIIIGLGIAFAALLFNPQVRAAVKQFIIEVFDQFTHISFSNNESSLDDASWYPEWLPEGFKLVREARTSEITRVIFIRDDVKINIVYYSSESFSHSTDNEQIELDAVIVDQVEYFFGSTEVPDKVNKILFEKENNKFVIESTVDLDILLEVAKSIKK